HFEFENSGQCPKATVAAAVWAAPTLRERPPPRVQARRPADSVREAQSPSQRHFSRQFLRVLSALSQNKVAAPASPPPAGSWNQPSIRFFPQWPCPAGAATDARACKPHKASASVLHQDRKSTRLNSSH